MTMGAEHISRFEQVNTSSDVGLADPGCYRILVKGCLDSSWSDWFDNLAVVADSRCGQTMIFGWLADQAALHGLLNKVQNLGLVLLAVTLVQEGSPSGERSARPGDSGVPDSLGGVQS